MVNAEWELIFLSYFTPKQVLSTICLSLKYSERNLLLSVLTENFPVIYKNSLLHDHSFYDYVFRNITYHISGIISKYNGTLVYAYY